MSRPEFLVGLLRLSAEKPVEDPAGLEGVDVINLMIAIGFSPRITQGHVDPMTFLSTVALIHHFLLVSLPN